MRWVSAAGATLMTLGLAACNTAAPSAPVAAAAVPNPQAAAVPPAAPASANSAIRGPLLGPDGRCTGAAPAQATEIVPGIGECDLVRLKGKPATDVLVGESGKGQREVQVLYAEPGGKELYFFVDNRLERIVK